ncbi:hypothetical protein QBC44DRAFT_43713 [Cladorrhinum sp. PSN332]|nr:hypothetical protein QBC44DRAFT_43713 [Cladorrhinum sp. PSN332]
MTRMQVSGPISARLEDERLRSAQGSDLPLTWDNLWSAAYASLQADPEHAGLLSSFEAYLKKVNRLDTEADRSHREDGSQPRLDVIQQLAKDKLEKCQEARTSVSIGRKTIVVRDVVSKTIALVSTFKQLIGSAIEAEPHAALAWVGVMTILPMLENIFQQDEDAASGLQKIVFLLVRYRQMQDQILVPRNQDPSLSDTASKLISSIGTELVSLYTKVYIYQIRLVLQYSRHKVHRLARNAVSADDWKTLWEEIDSIAQDIDKGVDSTVNGYTIKGLDTLIEKNRTIHELVEDGNETRLLLELPTANNAIFDSDAVSDTEAPCLKGTQVEILDDIQRWMETPGGEPVFWLSGMAGTGKTSISVTVCEALSKRQPLSGGDQQPPRGIYLGASFFFKQGDVTRNSTKAIFPTIARRLAQSCPELKSLIAEAVKNNLEIGTKGQSQQFRDLILNPLLKLDQQAYVPLRLVVVVDALDECINTSEAGELIGTLKALESLEQVQLRVLVTSRRDDHLVKGFGYAGSSWCRHALLEKIPLRPVSQTDRTDDITHYLTHTLRQIAEKYDSPHGLIGGDWIMKLSKKADGLFIYAATTCRFLDFEDFVEDEAREERLDLIYNDEMEIDAPQLKIDEIYLKVLSFPHLYRATQREKKRFFDLIERILGFITVSLEPVSASSLAVFLRLEMLELGKKLQRLHSVIAVPRDTNIPMSLIHLSFRDFLLSQQRSARLSFRVQETLVHYTILQRCLDLMSEYLKEDICGLIYPGHLNAEVPQAQVEEHIPQYLQYACRYWVDHLERLGDASQRQEKGLYDGGPVHIFLKEKLLFWLEGMGLIREAPRTIIVINKLQSLVNSAQSPDLYALVNDAKRFVMKYRWIIEHASLQLYSSALIFSPMKSIVRSLFEHLIPYPTWITHKPQVEEEWNSEYLALEGHLDYIHAVACSPTDDHIASSSNDGTVRVWDYITGTELYKFDAYDPSGLAFSSDGKKIAVGSFSGLINIVELSTGTTTSLIGHTDRVHTLQFSPCLKRSILASESYWQGSIRIWDVDSESTLQIISLPASNFSRDSSFSFSPQGEFLAVRFGSIINLWSLGTKEIVRSFQGHSKRIDTVIYSMDGKTLISRSLDEGKVIVWDVQTGVELHTTCIARGVGPGEPETVLICTPEGSVLGLMVDDNGVEVRSAGEWNLPADPGPRISSNSASWLVSFSRDFKLLAAATFLDRAIRLWDVASVLKPVRPRPEADTAIRLFDVLPTGDIAILGGWTGGARIWSATPGLELQCKVSECDLACVRQATFSPDGRYAILTLEHSPESKSIQVWDYTLTNMLVGYVDIFYFSMSPDSRRMAVRFGDGVKIIDTATFEETGLFSCQHIPVLHPLERFGEVLTFSPGGRILGWEAQHDGISTLCLWDISSIQPQQLGHCFAGVLTFTFSQNAEFLICQQKADESDEKYCALLEVATMKERRLTGYWEVAFHPKFNLVLTKTSDGTILVQDITTCTSLYDLPSNIDGYRSNSWFFTESGELVLVQERALGSSSSVTGPQAAKKKAIVQLWDINPHGASEINRVAVDVDIAGPSLCRAFPCLEWRGGRFPIPYPIDTQDGVEESRALEAAARCLCQGREWIIQGYNNLLWLPQEYRKCRQVVGDSSITFAPNKDGSRGVVMIKFDLKKTPLPHRIKRSPPPAKR